VAQQRMDAAAERAYMAFCTSPASVYLPRHLTLFPATWAELPEVLKDAWRAAAAAALTE
jgi:hypothetical protein